MLLLHTKYNRNSSTSIAVCGFDWIAAAAADVVVVHDDKRLFSFELIKMPFELNAYCVGTCARA